MIRDGQRPRVRRVGFDVRLEGFERGAISPHRAAFDVVATAAVFEELIKHARWSELVQWSREPALHTRLHFGKYRGKRYDEIAATDLSYLQWIVEKSELEEGIKHSARYWLATVRGPQGGGIRECSIDGLICAPSIGASRERKSK